MLTKKGQKRKIAGLFNDFKLNPFHFHSLETFGRFIQHSLNLKSEVVKEIISNPRIQYWIDKNRSHGFVYQTYPRSNSISNQKDFNLLNINFSLNSN